jgi:hypothetical protein
MRWGGSHRLSALIALALVSLAAASGGCATAKSAQVVDAETGAPVAGANVVGVWTRRAGIPGLQHAELVAVRESETDAQGRFHLPAPASYLVGEDNEAITVYKYGYVAWSNLFVFPTWARRSSQRVPSTIALERFPPGQPRSAHMTFVRSVRRSSLYGREQIPQFIRAQREEELMP